MPSEPSVTMSGGIFALAMRKPFSSPQQTPLRIATRMPTIATPQPSPPIARMTRAATTPENTSTEPTDRSMPAVMMTYVIPTARTARIEAFWMMRRKLVHCANESGARMLKTMMIARSTRRIWKACVRRIRRTGFTFWLSSKVPIATVSVGGVVVLTSGRPS